MYLCLVSFNKAEASLAESDGTNDDAYTVNSQIASFLLKRFIYFHVSEKKNNLYFHFVGIEKTKKKDERISSACSSCEIGLQSILVSTCIVFFESFFFKKT